MARRAEYLFGVAVLDDAPGPHHGDPLANLRGYPRVVRNAHHRHRVLPLQGGQQGEVPACTAMSRLDTISSDTSTAGSKASARQADALRCQPENSCCRRASESAGSPAWTSNAATRHGPAARWR